MSFEEYLISKNIHKEAFKTAEPERYVEWSILFNQIHPDSFTLQKKFLLNPIRRKYLLKKE
jgi:hypothetical protein